MRTDPAPTVDDADQPEPDAMPDAADDPVPILPAEPIAGDDPGLETATDAVTPDQPAGDVDSGGTSDVEALPEPVVLDLPPVERGQVLAKLELPSIGVQTFVVPGVGTEDLKKGPGHYPNTPLPGQMGNSSIAGHRTTWGSPFFDVDKLQPGDEIITTLTNGDRFVYEVTGTEIVGAADGWVINTTDPNVAELTLTSCHPAYTARERIIIRSQLNPEKSSNVGVATFYDLGSEVSEEEPVEGDDPVVTLPDEAAGAGDADDTSAGETAAPDGQETAGLGSDSGSAAPPDDASGTDDPTVTSEEQVVADETGIVSDPTGTVTVTDDTLPAGFSDQPVAEVDDAFAEGWFSDRDAFPQIALWAAVLTLIGVIGYLISRRLRSYPIGVFVSAAPFVVALYFFYQNVNRLLPPGL